MLNETKDHEPQVDTLKS